jgi:hypothetical protein
MFSCAHQNSHLTGRNRFTRIGVKFEIVFSGENIAAAVAHGASHRTDLTQRWIETWNRDSAMSQMGWHEHIVPHMRAASWGGSVALAVPLVLVSCGAARVRGLANIEPPKGSSRSDLVAKLSA